MVVTALEKAVNERDTATTTLSIMKDQIATHTTTPFNHAQILHFINKTEVLRKEISEIHNRILGYGPHNPDDHELIQRNAMATLFKMESDLNALITPVGTSGSSSTRANQYRLPKIDIPIFDGELNNWLGFRDLYVSAIHNNNEWSDAQKLTYLKTKLTGSASNLVKSIQPTDANYQPAWKSLQDRYENKRELVFSILSRFSGQSAMEKNSASALRSLVDVSKECVRSLESLVATDEHRDAMLVFGILQKVDTSTRQFWEQSLANTAVPKLDEFLGFLEQRARALASGGICDNTEKKSQKPTNSRKANVHHANKTACQICGESHFVFRCPKLRAMNVNDRYEIVKKNALCFNCLQSGHSAPKCKSTFRCIECKKRHNTLLHPTTAPAQEGNEKVLTSVVSHHSSDSTHTGHGLLATAMVKVENKYEVPQLSRALLDSGATASFITESCANRLGLTKKRIEADVDGLASMKIGKVDSCCELTVQPYFHTDEKTSYTVTCLIMPHITANLPYQKYDQDKLTHLNGLQLADPQWYEPGKVDILLGGDIFWELLMGGKRYGPKGSPLANETRLGWVVAGKVTEDYSKIRVHHVGVTLDQQLQQFWELESVPTTRMLTSEEKQCEQHFVDNFSRAPNGKFSVSLPFDVSRPALGASRDMAIRRLKSLEKRLAKLPEMRQNYVEFMQQYLSLGHMELVSHFSPNHIEQGTSVVNPDGYYIPHHFVLKESSTTTKFRVVFDASAKTSTGTSLNERLMVGPTIQDSLVDILMRFRTHTIAFTADITKMYRQISVHPKDVNWQRIVWRDDPAEEIKDYKLVTVTYGTASAPFHATRVLHQLALEEEKTMAVAAKTMKEDFYMDDLMSGSSNVANAVTTVKDLVKLSSLGKFELRKWSCNSSEVLESLPKEMRETQIPLSMDNDGVVKTLGLYWNPGLDVFSFKVHLPVLSPVFKVTKRHVLSEVAKLFDPLGWLAPVIITAKILLQQMWKSEVGWDDPLPLSILQPWMNFRSQLHLIEKIKIPRNIYSDGADRITIHGFSDASELAYSAVVYSRVEQDIPVNSQDSSPRIIVNLLTAKTRVAPVKKVSLPRLELCGAVLLSKLMGTVHRAHKLPVDQLHAWSDSTVVLDWIHGCPSKWKTFVANRVTEVQDGISLTWGFVEGTNNPADCASRGIMPNELENHSLWWTGPSWLKESIPAPWTSNRVTCPTSTALVEEEAKKIIVTTATTVVKNSLPFYPSSSLKKLKRVVAWVQRFGFNCRSVVNSRRKGSLSTGELENSMMFLIKSVQSEKFGQEIRCLKKQLALPKTSKLKTLGPFLDVNQILRVGGRLRHADIPVDQRNPILLPQQHELTQLVIRNEHDLTLHGGIQLMLTNLQTRYWIINGKDSIRHFVRRCPVCIRHRAAVVIQPMADLPKCRVTPTRPFLTCGVDYAGPFQVRAIPARSKVTYKSYLALFICFSTRAVHLEVVSSLSTDAFLAAFKRFTARRGKCKDVYSDRGTNFVGAARELKEFMELVKSDEHNQFMARTLADEGINWHFNPAGAPHFGGLWEAGVKSAKYHLHRIAGSARLTFEEMTTIMTQVEACLNSRPLTPLSTDPMDLSTLTPGHFLIGEALLAIPEPDLTKERLNRLSRWQMVQQMTQHFWNRWSKEFLARLQQRPKWLKQRVDIHVGDMVLVKEDNLPPLKWRLGRIIQLHPGVDGVTRVATVRTAEGEIKRPVVKLCLLPMDKSINEDIDNVSV